MNKQMEIGDMKTKLKKVLIWSSIILGVLVALLFIVLMVTTTIYTRSDHGTQVIEQSIELKTGTEIECYREIERTIGDTYIKDLDLTRVEVKIDNKENIINGTATEMVFYFTKYINSFAEGGNIKAAEIYVDIINQKITKCNTYAGGSKAYSGGGSEKVDFLESVNYKKHLNDICKNYGIDEIKESENAMAIVRYSNNGRNRSVSKVLYVNDFVEYEDIVYLDQ